MGTRDKTMFLLRKPKLKEYFGAKGRSVLGHYETETRNIKIFLSPYFGRRIKPIPNTIQHEFLHKLIHRATGRAYYNIEDKYEERIIGRLCPLRWRYSVAQMETYWAVKDLRPKYKENWKEFEMEKHKQKEERLK